MRYLPVSWPRLHGLEVTRDVPYADEVGEGKSPHARTLDIYRPMNASAPLPVVMYVHGGGFRSYSKDSHWIMAVIFAKPYKTPPGFESGFLLFNCNYRLTPQHRYPCGLEDVCLAYEWVVTNCARYGGDPTRIVLSGESAGANLVTCITIACCYERPEPWARRVYELDARPAAVVPACGIFQVTNIERFRTRFPRMQGFLTRYIEGCTSRYLGDVHAAPAPEHALADPLLVFESGLPPQRPLPPFFMSVGDCDPLKIDQERMERSLENLGVDVVSRCDTHARTHTQTHTRATHTAPQTHSNNPA